MSNELNAIVRQGVVEAPKHGRALTDVLEPLDKDRVFAHADDLPEHWLLDVLRESSPCQSSWLQLHLPAAYVTGVLEDPSNPGSPAQAGSSRVFKIESHFQGVPGRNPATMNWQEPPVLMAKVPSKGGPSSLMSASSSGGDEPRPAST
ncbi:hypothetical protein PLEOSDRAFT_164330 [Pleurotus ostreatus PC15]|uniref:Uncharacterized protein n=1 Tax=Pleurotus ostreatus (strain PC15) TaxID=1137138 RepID=A0A067PCG7_PLEO1|nr:hypothetical protein PLEOSDRAFT_164330 [Pleurotus ostreatus PC15]